MRFFFALLSLFRIHLHIGLFDRPLLVGLILAVFSAHPADIIGTALVLELLWLDTFAAGTVIPPNRLLPLFLTALTATALNLHGAAQLFVPLCFFITTPHMAAMLAGWVRRRQNICHALIQDWANRGDARDLPARFILRGTLLFFLSHAALFIILFLGVILAAQVWLWYMPGTVLVDISDSFWPALSWPWLILAAGVGGFLALRLKHTRILFAGAFLVLLGLFIFFLG